jgi:hypothetical protein
MRTQGAHFGAHFGQMPEMGHMPAGTPFDNRLK